MATYIDKLKINGVTYDLALTPNKGDSNTPVYFDSNGLPQACTSLDLNTSGTAAGLVYPAQLSTQDALDGFLSANTFKVGYWNGFTPTGLISNGIVLSGGWTSTSYGFQIAIDDDPTYKIWLRQKSTSWSDWKAIPMADGTHATGTWPVSISGSSTSCTGNAHSTSIDGTCIAYAGWSNEFNFGGSNAASTIYIGYRAIDSKPIPTGFIFGGADGSATLTAKSLSNAGRSVSWISGRDSALVKFTSYNGYNAITSMKTTNGSWEMGVYSNDTMYFNYAPDTNYNAGTNSTVQVSINSSGYLSASRVYGAVWNDYAEYRESDCEEFGRVLIEKGDDSLTQSTERLQHFAGISSDTWGFCQGETEKAKTPIAVAGRVLAYPYQDRDNYKPGDCVCAAPGGTVDIMTREEVINWPDRIIGTVSCVPDYEEWGSGDRDPVKVDGRIWIKVK